MTDCYTRIKDGQFLSTPSARRATNYRHLILAAQNISIHALREEGDLPFCPASSRRGQFLSTPSARRATSHRPGEPRGPDISIHALREEGDERTALLTH